MAALIVAGIIMTAIVVFDLVAITYGVDSRPVTEIDRAPGGLFPL